MISQEILESFDQMSTEAMGLLEDEGFRAALDQRGFATNPYNKKTAESLLWKSGYEAGISFLGTER